MWIKHVGCFISMIGLCVLSGCGNTVADNGSTLEQMVADYEVEKMMSKEELTEYEDVGAFFDSVTGDMLDACNTVPKDVVEAFANDSLILLNWYRDDIRLYGIRAGEEEAMLLYAQGEKLLIPYPYRNLYYDTPAMNVCDIDEDGEEEVIIRPRTGTGTPGYWFTLLVCDKEDGWVIRKYDHNVEDIEALIDYQYDEASNTIAFLSREEGTLLAEVSLPEWTEEYPYTGEVEYGNSISYDVEVMQMQSEPWIILENSLPYMGVTFIFDIQYRDGEFEIELNDTQLGQDCINK